MAVGDVRAVLQYVPLFRGRAFLLLFDSDLPESAVAEALLDVKALQEVGVHLVIGVLGDNPGEIADRATEIEIKFTPLPAEGDPGEVVESCRRILQRGQAALLDWRGQSPLGEEVVGLGRELQAAKLIVLLNGPGVTRDGSPLHAVSTSQVPEVISTVTHGELLRAAAEACAQGIPRVHVLDGRRQGVLADELFSNEGVGTMVHADSYREVRELREEDIPELLAMIGRSVRRAHLVPRDYDEIARRGEDFLVLCVDDNVVGCVAVHPFERIGEIACLYVKQSHEHLGYGRELVSAAEEKARAAGLPEVFALTNRAAPFFESLEYQRAGVEVVPAERRHKLEASSRESAVLRKSLGE